jgi:hypothetical protein
VSHLTFMRVRWAASFSIIIALQCPRLGTCPLTRVYVGLCARGGGGGLLGRVGFAGGCEDGLGDQQHAVRNQLVWVRLRPAPPQTPSARLAVPAVTLAAAPAAAGVQLPGHHRLV